MRYTYLSLYVKQSTFLRMVYEIKISIKRAFKAWHAVVMQNNVLMDDVGDFLSPSPKGIIENISVRKRGLTRAFSGQLKPFV